MEGRRMKHWRLFSLLFLLLVFVIGAGNTAHGSGLTQEKTPPAYKMLINEQEAGVVQFPARGLFLYDEAIAELSKQYADDVRLEADVLFVEIESQANTDEEALYQQIQKLTKAKTNGYAFYIDNEFAFYMKDKEAFETIVEQVKQPYAVVHNETQKTTEPIDVYIKEAITTEPLEVNVNDLAEPETVTEMMTKPVTKGDIYLVQEGDSFWEIATRKDLTIDRLKELNPDIDPDKLSIGMELTLTIEKPPLTVVTKEILTYQQPIAYDKETNKNASMYVDEKKTTQEGKDGELEVAIEVVYENGTEVTRAITNETVIVEPVTQITEIGTKERPKPVVTPSVPVATGDIQKLHWDTVTNLWSRSFGAARITDIWSGKTFYVMRTGGTLHADVETATAKDTEIFKSIFNGYCWDRRPIIVEVNGYKIGASMSGMPHAGVDSQPNRAYVSGRSAGYGSGTNYDGVKGNGMDGHFDVHFYGSKRHKDGRTDSEHQARIASIFS